MGSDECVASTHLGKHLRLAKEYAHPDVQRVCILRDVRI